MLFVSGLFDALVGRKPRPHNLLLYYISNVNSRFVFREGFVVKYGADSAVIVLQEVRGAPAPVE
jgi:hypothetical protein